MMAFASKPTVTGASPLRRALVERRRMFADRFPTESGRKLFKQFEAAATAGEPVAMWAAELGIALSRVGDEFTARRFYAAHGSQDRTLLLDEHDDTHELEDGGR